MQRDLHGPRGERNDFLMATKTKESAAQRHKGDQARPEYDTLLYEEAVLGFKNYWYPILSSKSVGRRPVSITIMKEPIVLMRTVEGQARALTDECAHRPHSSP